MLLKLEKSNEADLQGKSEEENVKFISPAVQAFIYGSGNRMKNVF